jgi:hypothetical protein
MVSDLISYELVLFGLLWLCIMLQYVWPSDGPAGDQRTSKPAKPPRPRSRDPKPFPGLIRQPHCDGCEQATAVLPLPPPPAPPPVISHTRGCPCQVDPAAQLCPNPDGASYGRVGWGNLHANGHPNRVVFGTTSAVEQVLAACAWQITTAFIERANLSIRQHVPADRRKGLGEVLKPRLTCS